MQEFLIRSGLDNDLFHYVVLPTLIFFARVLDVSLNTLRIIFVMAGRKFISSILGFFESLIWLLAIGQIFEHIDNIYAYIAYPMGFAVGILVGMIIEEHLALGKVVVRIIGTDDLTNILTFLKENKLRYTILSAEGESGKEKILFTVLKRESLPDLVDEIKTQLPHVFYTIESVKKASEPGLLVEKPSRRGLGTWLGSVKRK